MDKEYFNGMKIIKNHLQFDDHESLMFEKIVGCGEHGTVYKIKNTNMVLKNFNIQGVEGRYFDYENLLPLQGIDIVPDLYAYKEKTFVIMEYVGRNTVFNYINKHKDYPPDFKSVVEISITDIVLKHNISLIDVKPSFHFFWMEDTKKIKLVDFGLCSRIDHLSYDFKIMIVKTDIQSIYEEFELYYPFLKEK